MREEEACHEILEEGVDDVCWLANTPADDREVADRQVN